MAPQVNVKGNRHGALVLIARVATGRWLCLCDCGVKKVMDVAAVRAGRAKSCGCLKGPLVRAAGIARHRTPERMAQRRERYARYGPPIDWDEARADLENY